jgi:hypothetical protein
MKPLEKFGLVATGMVLLLASGRHLYPQVAVLQQPAATQWLAVIGQCLPAIVVVEMARHQPGQPGLEVAWMLIALAALAIGSPLAFALAVPFAITLVVFLAAERQWLGMWAGMAALTAAIFGLTLLWTTNPLAGADW